jgi:hypothetical protein
LLQLEVSEEVILMKLFNIAIAAFALLAVALAPPLIAAETQSIVGDWKGRLDKGRSKVLVVLHVERTREGKLEATLEGITKHQLDVEVESIKFSAPDLHFAIEGGNGVYDAKLSHDSSKLVGVWKQGESAMPLVFQRVTDDFVQNLTTHPMTGLVETWAMVRAAMEHGIVRLRMLMTAYAVSGSGDHGTGKSIVQVL